MTLSASRFKVGPKEVSPRQYIWQRSLHSHARGDVLHELTLCGKRRLTFSPGFPFEALPRPRQLGGRLICIRTFAARVQDRSLYTAIHYGSSEDLLTLLSGGPAAEKLLSSNHIYRVGFEDRKLERLVGHSLTLNLVILAHNFRSFSSAPTLSPNAAFAGERHDTDSLCGDDGWAKRVQVLGEAHRTGSRRERHYGGATSRRHPAPFCFIFQLSGMYVSGRIHTAAPWLAFLLRLLTKC